MTKKKMNFSCLNNNPDGKLSPDDVHLFYYDIGIDSETVNVFVYNWNNDVESFIAANSLNINSCEANLMPSAYSNNEILFTIGNDDKNNKAIALFRHLRNAFAHYHINLSGEYYCMKDSYYVGQKGSKVEKVTMMGKIHRQFFIELMEIFFKQKSDAENEAQKYYYPEK